MVSAEQDRDVPYLPSYLIPLSEVSASLKNLQDLLFLPGYHSPTLALLYNPTLTFSGRYGTGKDTAALEIRTFDPSSTGSSYPLLTSVTNLPSDSLYLVSCPPELGGTVIITCTGIVHVDQSGRTVATGVNGWWSYITDMRADTTSEDRLLTLEGSKGVFVSERDMLLVLQDGDVHQVRFEMDGRAVGAIKVDESSSTVPTPSSVIVAGERAVFVASAEGNSLLAKVVMKRDIAVNGHVNSEMDNFMEVDYDEGEVSSSPRSLTKLRSIR